MKVCCRLCRPDLQLQSLNRDFLHVTRFLGESPRTTARFAVILVLLDTKFRDPMRKYTQFCATDPIYRCP